MGRASQLSGITADVSCGCEGFCNGLVVPEGQMPRRICGELFALCFPKEKTDFTTGLVTIPKDPFVLKRYRDGNRSVLLLG